MGRLRENPPGIPLIVLSTRNDEEPRAHFLLAGARECIPKPFSCDALRAAMDKCAARGEYPDPRTLQMPGPAVLEVSHAAAIGQHQTALRWLSRLSGHMRDPQQLAYSLSDALADVFHAARCAVLLETEGEGVRVVASAGLPNGLADSLRFGFSDGLMRWLEQHVCLIDRLTNGADDETMKELQVLGARLAAPLLVSGRVCGALVLGEKSSGINYSMEERDLLTALARSASTSLENAELYQNVYRQQRRLDAVLGNLRTGVVVVSPDRRVSLMNKATERILQVRGTDVLGRSVQKLGSGFADVILRTMKEGKPRLRQEVHDPAINATLGLSATPLDDGGVVVVFRGFRKNRRRGKTSRTATSGNTWRRGWPEDQKNPMVAINALRPTAAQEIRYEDFRQAFQRERCSRSHPASTT